MHITALMQEYGAPMTRDEYLRWSNMGKSGKVTPEEEAELPQRFAYPVVSHETLPEPKLASKKGVGKGKGAPVGFGGPVFPNEGGITPELDTAPPAVHPTKIVGAQARSESYKGGMTMDTSNTPQNWEPPQPREQ